MYNRYIPQSDGTYRRAQLPDRPPRQTVQQESKQEHKNASAPPAATPPCAIQNPRACPIPHPQLQKNSKIQKYSHGSSITGFLKQLLPSNFDTSDLLVILILLLMSGDCSEDQNSALLTLALYLFM